jgi:hypothetical protein
MSADQQPATGKGFIYILSNESMPGLLKVGLTENSVRQRIRELSSNTGVPTEFKLERAFEIEASLLLRVEQTIHRELKQAGFHHQKEFFKLSISQCMTVAEDVILQVTGVRSPEIVGLAERRLKAKEAKEKWEAEELSRRKNLLQEANEKIATQREHWINAKKVSSQSESNEPWYSAIGNFILLLIGIPFLLAMLYALGLALFETVGFGLGVLLIGVSAYWFYQKNQKEKEDYEKLLRDEAARQFPFKTLDQFEKRDYIEEKINEERRFRVTEEQKLQSRIARYREDRLREQGNTTVAKRRKSWRFFRQKNNFYILKQIRILLKGRSGLSVTLI